ncbi:hypothetical protein [Aeromonas media]|uniref:hypothetical protein n=1 Tax=Aeromonas media TaxID=651 RepID=UPI0016005CCA|nr:hypothetical protein [Aeromonas media]
MNNIIKPVAFSLCFYLPSVFAGPAEIAREALNIQAVQFDSSTSTLTIVATHGDKVNNNQLVTSILLGYCDAVLSGDGDMQRVRTVNVINGNRSHGFSLSSSSQACEEIDYDDIGDDEISKIIMSHARPYNVQSLK